MKKLLCILLVIVLTLSLTACLTDKQKEEVREKESIATEKFTSFLKENYKTYKIKETEQVISGNFLKGHKVTSFTKFVVNINKETHNFYYDADTNEVWSDVNYDKVIKELKKYYIDKLTDAEPHKFEFDILCDNREFCAIRHEDTSAEDVFNRIKEDKTSYFFRGYFAYHNTSITPEDFDFDKVFSETYNIHFTLVNDNGKSCDNIWVEKGDHLIDYMFISDCDLEDGQDRKFDVRYHHHDYKKVGDITFAYSSRYVDIDVESVKDYLGYVTGGDTKNYTYTPLGVGYNIKITPKQEKVWGGEVYDITTENGTIVHVSEDVTDKIYIYNDFEDDSDIWFFTESEDEYGTLKNMNSFTIKKIKYTETIGLYKAERKR